MIDGGSRFAKTVCTVARAQPPPEFTGTARDKDTDSCRTFPFAASALVADIRYAAAALHNNPLLHKKSGGCTKTPSP